MAKMLTVCMEPSKGDKPRRLSGMDDQHSQAIKVLFLNKRLEINVFYFFI